MAIEWFSVLTWGAIWMCKSPTGGTRKFACPSEFANQEVYWATVFLYIGVGHST